ncbi:hypothetical protein BDN72DRAFT_305555 [Pluteus cervinus]|uniref:Uncharacterized protein n=1 Tax=Pluteus cervinus TaxID=181527 RepID=A0ACD3AFV8_9AGAR|nr:hypothetical protein BDN72DRAFT_305555 [Pluteus cervinus]
MTTMLSLNCLVVDTLMQFPIEIGSQKRVSDLQARIWEKVPRLESVSTKILPVSLDAHNAEEELKDTDFCKPQSLLHLKVLSKIFTNIKDDRVHVLIVPPEFDLKCFVFDYNKIITIKISITEVIATLQHAIFPKIPEPYRRNVLSPEINLWRVAYPMSSLEAEYPPTSGPPLKQTQQLSSLFATWPDPHGIHIAVRLSNTSRPHTSSCQNSTYHFI